MKRLYFVKPRAKILGATAIKFAKHARDLLENAKIYRSLDEAVKDCDIVIGTTGVWEKAKSHKKNVMSIERAAREAHNKAYRSIALVLGRDDVGMSKEEFTKKRLGGIYKVEREMPTRRELDLLFSEFESMISSKSSIRNKKEVSRVFKNLILNSKISKKEVHALITALK